MYCRKCGKYIDSDAEFCKDCDELSTYFDGKEPITPFSGNGQYSNNPYGNGNSYSNPFGNPYNGGYSNTQYGVPQAEGSRKEGFGKALAATILSSIAFFLIIIAFSVMSVALEEYTYGYGYYNSDAYYDMMEAALILALFSLGMSIPSLIMGISSMKCFFRAKNAGKVKPIPTLVLGIVSVALSGLTLLYVLLVFAMSAL